MRQPRKARKKFPVNEAKRATISSSQDRNLSCISSSEEEGVDEGRGHEGHRGVERPEEGRQGKDLDEDLDEDMFDRPLVQRIC